VLDHQGWICSPILPVRLERLKSHIHAVNPAATVFQLSAAVALASRPGTSACFDTKPRGTPRRFEQADTITAAVQSHEAGFAV